MSKKVLLCDNSTISRSDYDLILNWSSCNEDFKTRSIPKIIENNANEFRKQYLDWTHQLGCANISGKSVIDHLPLRVDFSLWWMSSIIEKSKWKSPGLYQVFQLFALNSVLDKIEEIDSIDVSIQNEGAYESIKEWCLKSKIKCNKVSNIRAVRPWSLFKKDLNYFPHFIKAIMWSAVYSASRWTIKKPSLNNKFHQENGDICIISYFFNIDKKKANKNIFYTSYWIKLHKVLSKSGRKINWVHLFVRSNEFPTYDKARLFVDKLNADRSNFDSHLLIDNYLSFDIVIKTLKDYLSLVFISRKLSDAQKYFSISEVSINFWNCLSRDWKCSLFGKTAMVSCLYLNIFEKIFKDMPKQRQGLYLLENQPWEKCMIYAWRKHGHGLIIGVPHATVSYWDLRYYPFSDEYLNFDINTTPLPDKVALNGLEAINMYIKEGFPPDRINKVEALRYLYLDNFQSNINIETPINGSIDLLVLGGHDPSSTREQMELLIDCLDMIDKEIKILVKPHPLMPIKESDYPELNFQVTLSPLSELALQYSIAFTSNSTAAAVDIYLAKKKVLIMHSCSTFNMSPLRGYEGVEFVKTAQELVACLSEFTNDPTMFINKNFFYLDNELPKWKKLLNI